MRILVLLALLSLTLFKRSVAQQLKSPDGKFLMSFSLQGNGTPFYTLAHKGKVVIKPSKLHEHQLLHLIFLSQAKLM